MNIRLAVFVFLCVAFYTFGATVNIVSLSNEYGGQTVEYVIDATNASRMKVTRVLSYYDKDGSRRKFEYFHTEELVKEKGYFRAEVFYTKDGAVEKTINYFAEDFIKENGYSMVIIYPVSEDKEKVEYYLNKELLRSEEREL